MKNFNFIDANNHLVKIEINNRPDYFSICGEVVGCLGQCYDEIRPLTDAQDDLLHFWKEWHLHKLTDEATARLEDILGRLATDWENHRAEAAQKNKYDINSNDDQEMLLSIMSEMNCDDYHARCAVAVMREAGMDFSELCNLSWDEWTNNFTAYGVDYLAGTGDDLDDLALQYMKDSEDCYLECWIEAVKNEGERRGYDDWCEYVVNMDGFASILNTYDGKYNDIEVFGQWICVCRR